MRWLKIASAKSAINQDLTHYVSLTIRDIASNIQQS